MILHQKSLKIHYFLAPGLTNHVFDPPEKTDWRRKKSKTLEKRKNSSRKLSENEGGTS